MTALEFKILTNLPDDFLSLQKESVAEGFGMLARLRDAWDRGLNRFDRPDDLLLGVFQDGRIIAVGGLTPDPHLLDSTVGRLRHVYVLKRARRLGVGRRLVERLLGHARTRFARVRLSTEHAAAFYDSLGFHRSSEIGATHSFTIT